MKSKLIIEFRYFTTSQKIIHHVRNISEDENEKNKLNTHFEK